MGHSYFPNRIICCFAYPSTNWCSPVAQIKTSWCKVTTLLLVSLITFPFIPLNTTILKNQIKSLNLMKPGLYATCFSPRGFIVNPNIKFNRNKFSSFGDEIFGWVGTKSQFCIVLYNLNKTHKILILKWNYVSFILSV